MSEFRDRLGRLKRRLMWRNTGDFWEGIYKGGGHSGAGSYGQLAIFKAKTLNDFVSEKDVQSILEFGCGDGHQLSLATYPKYIGLDIAPSAIDRCSTRYQHDVTKSFFLYDPRRWVNRGAITADLTISLDVIFHLVEDDTYSRYMTHLFEAATRFVAIYASNHAEPHPEPYMRHHEFSQWVRTRASNWKEVRHIPNSYPFDPNRPNETSYSDFWFFERIGPSPYDAPS